MTVLSVLLATSLLVACLVWLAAREARLEAEALRASRDWFADVLAFHAKFRPDQIRETPGIPTLATEELRWRLVREEIDELREAIRLCDLPEIADAIADSIYVLLGMSIAYGIDLRPVWAEVHRTNMAKIGGGDDGGKVTKPAGWQPPDVAGILGRQGRIAA